MRKFSRRTIFVLISATALLAGCGVAQIDVDVYKGPLANHEDVQVQQFSVMANGAKPLLVSLRNSLEENILEAQGISRESFAKDQRVGTDYYSGYIRGAYNFRSPEARRTNDVLSLYENRNLPDPIAARIGILLDEFGSSVQAYYRKQPGTPKWQNYESGLKAQVKKLPDTKFPPRSTAAAQLKPASASSSDKTSDANKIALQASETICGANSSPKDTNLQIGILRDAYRKMVDNSGDPANFHVVPECILSVNNTLRALGGDFANWPSVDVTSEANAGFEVLSRGELVRAHAQYLFQDSRIGDRFTDDVTALARAFLTSRLRLHDVMTLALKSIAAESDAIGGQRESNRLNGLSKIVTHVIGRTNLSAALIGAGAQSPEILGLRQAIRTEIRSDDFNKIIEMDFPAFNAMMIKLLTSASGRSHAWGFLALDEEFRAGSFSSAGLAQDTQYLSKPSARRYGLTRFVSAPIIGVLADNLLPEAEALLGGSFARGRPEEGLDTLIEAYQRSLHARRPYSTTDSGQNGVEFTRLRDALVQFAQKILFVANNDGILRSPSAEERKYILMLQTVGNNILYQADELRQRAENRTKMETSLSREQSGYGAIHPASVGHMLDDLARSIQIGGPTDAAVAKLAELRKKAEGVGERLAADNLDVKTKTGDQSNAEKALKAALESCRVAKSLYLLLSDIKVTTPRTESTDEKVSCTTSLPAARLNDLRTKLQLISQLPAGPVDKALATDVRTRVNGLFDSETAAATATVVENAAAVVNMLKAIQAEFAGLPVSETQKAYHAVFEEMGKESARPFNDKNKTWLSEKGNKELADTAVKTATDKAQATKEEKAKIDQQVESEGKAASGEAAEAARLIANAKERVVARFASDTERQSPLPLPPRVVEALIAEIASTRGVAQPAHVAAAMPALPSIPVTRGTAATASQSAAPQSQQGANAAVSIDRVIALIREAPLPTAGVTASASNLSARDVLDQEIAELRYIYIDRVSKFGKDHPASKNIDAAITAALDQRAGMAYIRPSAAYLRSSYAASGFQDNSGTGRQDLLGRRALDAFPALNSLLTYNEDTKTILEIDKQFWQNINRVKVSGTGKTNYAIAKDDVGNWYVKSYAADAEVIFKSASQLAMFGLGAKLGTNLNNFAKSPADAGAAAGVPLQNTSRTTLERLLDRYADAFATATEEHRISMETALSDKGLNVQIAEAWDRTVQANKGATANNDDMTALLNKAKAELTTIYGDLKPARTAVEAKSTTVRADRKGQDASEKGTRIVAALADTARFGKKLANGVASLPIGSSMSGEVTDARTKDWNDMRAKLAESTRSVVGGFVRRMAGNREASLQSYSASLTFIGQAATDKPSGPAVPEAPRLPVN